jgi:hypothetical protein
MQQCRQRRQSRHCRAAAGGAAGAPAAHGRRVNIQPQRRCAWSILCDEGVHGPDRRVPLEDPVGALVDIAIAETLETSAHNAAVCETADVLRARIRNALSLSRIFLLVA